MRKAERVSISISIGCYWEQGTGARVCVLAIPGVNKKTTSTFCIAPRTELCTRSCPVAWVGWRKQGLLLRPEYCVNNF